MIRQQGVVAETAVGAAVSASIKQVSNTASLSGECTANDVSKGTSSLSTIRVTSQEQQQQQSHTKRKKRTSPFRIKTGCIVACRINNRLLDVNMNITTSPQQHNETSVKTANANTNGGNETATLDTSNNRNSDNVSMWNDTVSSSGAAVTKMMNRDTYTMVWTEALPHRDLFWSLIGKRIRCCIPVPTKDQMKLHSNKTLEGEVIRVIATSQQFIGDWGYNDVELLVDANKIQSFPFLRPIDDDIIDVSKLKASALRSYEMEQHVARGGGQNNKQQQFVTIVLRLQYPTLTEVQLPIIKTITENGHSNHNTSSKDGVQVDTVNKEITIVKKWVIQKCIPIDISENSKKVTNRKRKLVQNEDEAQTESSASSSKKMNGVLTSVTMNGTFCPQPLSGSQEVSDKKIPAVHQNEFMINNKNNVYRRPMGAYDDNRASSNYLDHNGQLPIVSNTTTSKRATRKARPSTSTAAKINKNSIKKSSVWYVGDGNDTPDQQIHNWRYVASRYHDLLFQSLLPSPSRDINCEIAIRTINSLRMKILSFGFIGEVVKVDTNADPSNTLAMITIRLMLLPEHTIRGRTHFDQANAIYVDFDNDTKSADDSFTSLNVTLPIEQLIIVSRNTNYPQNGNVLENSSTVDDAIIKYSYSRALNVYFPSGTETLQNGWKTQITDMNNIPLCHGCRCFIDVLHMSICKSADCALKSALHSDATTSISPIFWCKGCIKGIHSLTGNTAEATVEKLPCCTLLCDCFLCKRCRKVQVQRKLFTKVFKRTRKMLSITKPGSGKATTFNPLSLSANICQSFDHTKFSDFILPHDLINVSNLPLLLERATTRVPKRIKGYMRQRDGTSTTIVNGIEQQLARTRPKMMKILKKSTNAIANAPLPMKQGFVLLPKNHCAREIVHNFKSWMIEGHSLSFPLSEKPRSLRTLQESSTRLITEQKNALAKASDYSRAARVSQRRLLKDVASLGVTGPSYLGIVDTLASREPQLRFDRSKIHAWGVFADVAISAGEMIVEYRGEIIGNAVAELREIEYESAKIGSDYMFRIDSINVCDATKQGNVARFINASCDPNCVTKIINFDGSKRIVIYSKKDIKAGDELSYDYKFPLEYDESKRISCRCGARECRGYMNWDKKYVSLPNNEKRPLLSSSECKYIKSISEDV